MTGARKQSIRRALLYGVVAPLTLYLTALAAAPGLAAETLQDATAALREAAQRDGAAFAAALRQAIAADPARTQEVLRHALAAHPQRAAELLLASLYASPLQPPALPGAQPDIGSPATPEQAPGQPPEAAPQQEKAEAIEETGPWNGTVLLGATVRTGNTDNAGATSEVSVTYTEGPWRHRAGASVDYLRNRAQTQEQAFEGLYEAQYTVNGRTFAYGVAHYEDDRFSGFDYEFTTSLGLGRHLVKEEGHEWTVTLGPSLRIAQQNGSDDDDRALGGRFTNLLSWELSNTAELENETEALADRERLRVTNDVILKLRIIDQLSGQISFGLEYRSDTPDGAEHTDTTTRAAVVYDF